MILNNLQLLICNETQPTNQPPNEMRYYFFLSGWFIYSWILHWCWS